MATGLPVSGGDSSAWRLCCSGLAVAVLLGLCACGRQTGDQTNASGAGQDFLLAFQHGFEKSFNLAFAKSTHDSCVSSTVAHGAAADRAESFCACTVAQLMPLSVDEKRRLTATSDKVTEAVAHCRAQAQ
jgi:hypothetical protein